MRVTGQAQAGRAVSYIRRQQGRQAEYIDQISSGLRVRKPSDSPGDMAALVSGHAEVTRIAGYQAGSGEATATLNSSVSALLETTQLLVKASDLASQGANASADGPTYEALASEVDSMIDRMLSIANTEYNGRYLYGGTATQQPPFEVTARNAVGRPAAIGYVGAEERARGLVGPSLTVDTHYSGDHVFQATGGDVFQVLIGLRDDLRDQSTSNAVKSQTLTQRLGQLEQTRSRVLDTVGEQSGALSNLEAIQARLEDVQVTVRERTGQIEGTDYSAAIVGLQEQKSALEATLAVTARLFDRGLLDFIR